jgi:hypothetical protein
LIRFTLKFHKKNQENQDIPEKCRHEFMIALLALIALIAYPPWASAVQLPKRIVIVLDTKANDATGHGDLDLDDAYAIMGMEKQFPHSRVLLIRETENKKIREKLAELVRDPSVKVDALQVLSHGASFGGPGQRHFTPYIGNENGTFSVDLDNERSVQQVFGPLQGRFSDGAKLVFEGCHTVALGTEAEKKLVMKKVAKNFQMNSGRIYMNRTAGVKAIRTYFMQEIYSGGGTRTVTSRIAAQIFSPITFIPFLISERLLDNQGYTLELKNGRAELYRDNYFNAATTQLSVQEQRKVRVEAIWERLKKPLTPSERTRTNSESTPGTAIRGK